MFPQVLPTLKSMAKLSSRRRNGHPTEHRQRDNIDSERMDRKLRAGLLTALGSITSTCSILGSIPKSLQLIKAPGQIQPSLRRAMDLSTSHCRQMPSSVLGVYVFIKVAPLLARRTCREREREKEKERIHVWPCRGISLCTVVILPAEGAPAKILAPRFRY